MKLLPLLLLFSTILYAGDYTVYGPQGGLSMTVTLPDHFDVQTDTCPMVILMHGIFASQRITPMPTIARFGAEARLPKGASARRYVRSARSSYFCSLFWYDEGGARISSEHPTAGHLWYRSVVSWSSAYHPW